MLLLPKFFRSRQIASIQYARFKRTKSSVASSSEKSSHDGASDREVAGARTGAAISRSGKLAPRPPLVKNFFLGIVDKELLAYPEVIDREEMAALQNDVLPLKQAFGPGGALETFQTLDIAKNKESMESIKNLGLFGLNVSKDFEGKGLNWSESLIACESEALNTDLSLALLSHRVAVDLLEEKGTVEQKNLFLKQLAEGSLVATEAIYEYNAAEDVFFNTFAEYIAESRQWTLNGEKSFVVSGPLLPSARHLFLVIAETRRPNMTGDSARGTVLMLVDSSSPGVKMGAPHQTLGCRGTKISRVQFKDVVVGETCIMGHSHEGNQLADILLRSNRLRCSMLGLGLAKKLVNKLGEHCVETKQCGVSLSDIESARMNMSKALCATYAMESMIYYTAGLLDEFNNPDVILESAITKYFTLQQLFQLNQTAMNLIGPKCVHEDSDFGTFIRDSVQLYAQGETIDTLRLLIALTGLQHAGSLMSESVRKLRNPAFHPGTFLSKILQSSNIENPRTKLRLADNLHPTLEPGAQCLEQSVARLHMSVDLALIRHGNAIVERHNEIKRLAEMATHIFAMFASLSRASRAYCIGLRNADYELLVAMTICNDGRDIIKQLATDIFNGEYINNDNNLQRISKQIMKTKGYFPIHPLTYNF